MQQHQAPALAQHGQVPPSLPLGADGAQSPVNDTLAARMARLSHDVPPPELVLNAPGLNVPSTGGAACDAADGADRQVASGASAPAHAPAAPDRGGKGATVSGWIPSGASVDSSTSVTSDMSSSMNNDRSRPSVDGRMVSGDARIMSTDTDRTVSNDEMFRGILFDQVADTQEDYFSAARAPRRVGEVASDGGAVASASTSGSPVASTSASASASTCISTAHRSTSGAARPSPAHVQAGAGPRGDAAVARRTGRRSLPRWQQPPQQGGEQLHVSGSSSTSSASARQGSGGSGGSYFPSPSPSRLHGRRHRGGAAAPPSDATWPPPNWPSQGRPDARPCSENDLWDLFLSPETMLEPDFGGNVDGSNDIGKSGSMSLGLGGLDLQPGEAVRQQYATSHKRRGSEKRVRTTSMEREARRSELHQGVTPRSRLVSNDQGHGDGLGGVRSRSLGKGGEHDKETIAAAMAAVEETDADELAGQARGVADVDGVSRSGALDAAAQDEACDSLGGGGGGATAAVVKAEVNNARPGAAAASPSPSPSVSVSASASAAQAAADGRASSTAPSPLPSTTICTEPPGHSATAGTAVAAPTVVATDAAAPRHDSNGSPYQTPTDVYVPWWRPRVWPTAPVDAGAGSATGAMEAEAATAGQLAMLQREREQLARQHEVEQALLLKQQEQQKEQLILQQKHQKELQMLRELHASDERERGGVGMTIAPFLAAPQGPNDSASTSASARTSPVLEAPAAVELAAGIDIGQVDPSAAIVPPGSDIGFDAAVNAGFGMSSALDALPTSMSRSGSGSSASSLAIGLLEAELKAPTNMPEGDASGEGGGTKRSGRPKKQRGNYRCGKCGMTKAGHVCKFKKPPKEAKPVLKWVRHISTQSDSTITGAAGRTLADVEARKVGAEVREGADAEPQRT